MRKQYHFWPGRNGVDAWDVDGLIALSAGLPVVEVPVTSITEVDTPYWYDTSGEAPTVRSVIAHMRLVSEVDLSLPIILGRDGRVMDGMHRVARAILDGCDTLSARQFVEDPEPDYRDCQPSDLPYD